MLPALMFRHLPGLALAALLVGTGVPAAAQVSGFALGVAQAAAEDDAIAAFYRARDFAGLWTGADAQAVERRNAFLGALATAQAHALPADRFDPATLMIRMQAATGAGERGAMDVELSRILVAWAQAVGTGILDPGSVYGSMNKRERRALDATALLQDFAESRDPVSFLQALAPASPEYARLMAARLSLLDGVAAGGWGPQVQTDRLSPGDQGTQVVALRDRLAAMGYLAPSVTAEYDGAIAEAVRSFQEAHGLEPDAVAGASTIAEINRSPAERLRSVTVAMERERWLGPERGARHIWVNLTDFTARIVDEDTVTFETRSVIGAGAADRQSPEFSDEMQYLVLNPSWYVPRSITVGEYLPQLQRNPHAVSHIRVIDSRGRIVNRSSADFSRYSARSFPYSMVEPPSPGNALGIVKFMFPNPWAIYLHDTPSRSLFGREVRTFSHGCIRLQDPREFAHELLSRQTDDPVGMFNRILSTGAETRVDLEEPVPIHLDYRTAFTDADGRLQFRRDVYGRDARVWDALLAAGVEAPGVQG